MKKKNSFTVEFYKEKLIGKKSGKLTVVSHIGMVRGNQRWECLCECGKRCTRETRMLTASHENSCGCARKRAAAITNTKHGMWKTSEYRTYHGLQSRCYNKKNPEYKNYGARGIVVCDRWLESFENFIEDMGRKPFKNYSIDRIDGSKGYSKENCQWASPLTQSNNTRRNVFIIIDGKRATIAEHARSFGVNRKTARARLSKGWSVDEAFKTPVKASHKTNQSQLGSLENMYTSGASDSPDLLSEAV